MQDHIVAPEWVISGRADSELEGSLRKGGWGISPAPLLRGSAYTDFGAAHMSVPYGDSPAEVAVRLHEMIHARVSPASLPHKLTEQLGVTDNAVRVAEEVRVNLIGRMLGEESSVQGDTRFLSDGSEIGSAKAILARDSWIDALTLYLGTYNTEVHKKIRRIFLKNELWKEHFNRIDKWLKVKGWTFNNKVWNIMPSAGRTAPHSFVFVDERTGFHIETIIPSGFIEHTIPLAMMIDDWTTNPPAPFSQRDKDFSSSDDTKKPKSRFRESGNDWGQLNFGITSLTENTAKFIGKRKRPAMTGKYPSRLDRLLTDPERRIFTEISRGGNAIIVFDCSGSMRVTHDIVRDALEKFAGATVVCYTDSNRHANAWVVARGGRMINESDFMELPLGNGNGVDAPILRWALKQKRSHKDIVLWVSDGYVTGENDNFAQSLTDECVSLSLRHNIIGVDDYEEALQLLSDMKRTGRTPVRKFCTFFQNYLNGASHD